MRNLIRVLSAAMLGLVGLTCSAQTGSQPAQKVGYVTEYATLDDVVDDDEKASWEWFQEAYVDRGAGEFIQCSSVTTFDQERNPVLWIAIDGQNGDGRGIGTTWQTLPAAYKNLTAALATYVKAGGNLLLTNHATMLTQPIGRIDVAQTAVQTGTVGGNAGEVWGLNPVLKINGGPNDEHYDHSKHQIYEGIEFVECQALNGHEVLPLLSGGQREDHRCMWDLGTNLVGFQNDNTCTVIATECNVLDPTWAGLVEFRPIEDESNKYGEWKGTILTMGLGGYEWHQNNADGNQYQENMEIITEHMLGYLATRSQKSHTLLIDGEEERELTINGTTTLVARLDGEPVEATWTSSTEAVTLSGEGDEKTATAAVLGSAVISASAMTNDIVRKSITASNTVTITVGDGRSDLLHINDEAIEPNPAGSQDDGTIGTLTLRVDQTKTVSVDKTGLPEGTTVAWTSANTEKVTAQADADGVTGVLGGVAKTEAETPVRVTARLETTDGHWDEKVVKVVVLDKLAIDGGDRTLILGHDEPTLSITDGSHVTWTSSDEGVVGIDPNTGKVTPAAVGGPVTITATDDFGNTATIQITVTDGHDDLLDIDDPAVKPNDPNDPDDGTIGTLTLRVDQTKTVSVDKTALPEGTTVAWSSANTEKVTAQADADGVTGVLGGVAKTEAETPVRVTARLETTDGHWDEKVLKVVVLDKLAIDGPKDIWVDVNEASPEVGPLTVTDGSHVTWESSDEDKVTVDEEGNVTITDEAEKNDEVTITATDDFGNEAEVTIHFYDGNELIAFRDGLHDGDALTVRVGETRPVGIVPVSGATYQWSSDKEDKATVTYVAATGVASIEGKAVTETGAEATVTISATKGEEHATATLKVTVVAALSIEGGDRTLINGTEGPTLTVGDGSTVTWSSSAPEVVTIDSNTGKVTIVGVGGPATITATDERGNTATIQLTVVSGETDGLITFPDGLLDADGNLTVKVNETKNAQPENLPAGARVEWTVDEKDYSPERITLVKEGVHSGDVTGKAETEADKLVSVTVKVTLSDGRWQTKEFGVKVEPAAALRVVGAERGEVAIAVVGNAIVASGADKMVVYNLLGQEVYSGRGGSVRVAPGVYVVSADGSYRKLVIK